MSKSPLADDAVRGLTDERMRAVVADHWEWTMWWAPQWATTLGDHRYDDRLAPRDAKAIEQYHRERKALLAKLGAISPLELGDADHMAWLLLVASLHAAGAADAARAHEWWVSSRGGLVDEISYLVEMHPAGEGASLCARLRDAAGWIDQTIANLAIGLHYKRVAPKEAVRRAIVQLDGLLDTPTKTWAMSGSARAEHLEILAIVDELIAPKLRALRDFLRDRVLPVGRTGAAEGLCGMKGGEHMYRGYVEAHVGNGMSPDQIHALGLREIARTDDAIATLGATLFGAPDRAATIARLREDRALYFSAGAAIVSTAAEALARAKAAIPRFFGRLPVADCVMREIPAHEAPYTTIAYYREPHYDGTKPGEYFVNTYKPEVRPRFELEALTYHESIPGHHLQIAIAQELTDLPMFRKLGGSTAYIEGWALYTETLADEMGLYSSDLDRLGMHSYDAWRASRLVVDTGIHAKGWTRAQAEQFMLEHTALTPENISNEVDRYITDPGQALAYMVGKLAILELRKLAEDALGSRFDIRAFHDVILRDGALTLPVLSMRVGTWLRESGGDLSMHVHDHDHDHHH